MDGLLDIDSVLADLRTIGEIAQAGIISSREVQLEAGELRPAAVLYIDIAGFTELSRRLSPQQLGLLIDRTFRIFELTVRGQGGYCDKVIGDAALYVFLGHPNYPPAVEAAARAALSLQERARQINSSLEASCLSLALRCGLSFGEVSRRRVGGDEQQLTVMGATVNVAQRLEATAEPGTIQTTRMALERIGGAVQSERRGPVELKGFGVVEVHLITGVATAQPRLRGSGIRMSRIVGRDELLDEICAKAEEWWQTPGGDGHPANRILILQGGAAVGKSRLAYEAVERLLAEAGGARATAHCTPDGSLSAFASELVRVCGVTPEETVARWEQLCELAEQHKGREYAAAARRMLPLIALLSGSSEIDTRGARQADPQTFAKNVKQALRCACELAALESPHRVCLVIEDLQWMDEQRDLIASLLEEVDTPLPLLVIGTARPDYVHIACCVRRPEAGALCEAEAHVLQIPPLGPEAGRELMESLLPGLRLPEHIEAELHEKAIGLPYYYEEFARMLLRRWLVEEQGGAFLLSREVSELTLPEDLRMLILARLDTLPAQARELTMRAAVLGRRFSHELLAGMERRLGLLGEGELTRWIQLLLDQRIFIEYEGALFFEHILTHEAAYSGMLKHNRELLHAVAAELLTEMYVPGTADEVQLLHELIRHNQQAGRWLEEHINLCMLLSVMAQGADRFSWQQTLADAQRAYAKARELDPGLPEQSMHELLPSGMHYRFAGQIEQSRECFELLAQLSREAGEIGLTGKALNELGVLAFKAGRYDEALLNHYEALAIIHETGNRRVEVSIIGNIANVLSNQGELDEAQRFYEEALAMSRELGDLRMQGRNLSNLGLLALYRKDPQSARGYYEESLPLARRCGDRIGEQIRLGNLGNIYTSLQEYEEARACYRQSLQIAEEVGYLRGTGTTSLYMADLEIVCSNYSDAECLLARAESILAPLGDRLMLCHLYNAWTRVHLQREDVEAAREALRQAEEGVAAMRVGPESLIGEAVANTRRLFEERSRSIPAG